MRFRTRATLVAAAAGGALVTRRVIVARRHPGGAPAVTGRKEKPDRWHAVTVFLPMEEAAPEGRLRPGPLTELGDAVEVSLRPAPGGRGIEVAARPLDGGARVGDVRRALREHKSLLEAGEVVQPSGPPTTKRTLFNRPLEHATTHGREEGTL
jgi:hypothetical protein